MLAKLLLIAVPVLAYKIFQSTGPRIEPLVVFNAPSLGMFCWASLIFLAASVGFPCGLASFPMFIPATACSRFSSVNEIASAFNFIAVYSFIPRI